MSPAEKAEQLVIEFGTRNPFDIARALNIDVHMWNRPESKLPGMTCFVINRPSIFINEAYFDSLQRKNPLYTDEMRENDINQVGAHELGHAVLHRNELRGTLRKEYEIFNVRDNMEEEANIFAAGIRIDTATLIDLYNNSDLTLLQIASALKVNINLLIYKHLALSSSGYQFKRSPIEPRTNFMGNIKPSADYNG